MFQQETPQKYWNTFAFELKKILQDYGTDLSRLDDDVAIHREKVRRLIHSLNAPTGLPVLSREDTQMIIDKLQLEQKDIYRLQAALLATSIQRMLWDRIEPEAARLAAEQLLPIILTALIENADKYGLGNVRIGAMDPLEDSDIDQFFESVLRAIDAGTEALHLSYDRRVSLDDRVTWVSHAKASFAKACRELDRANRHIKQLPQWKMWLQQAEKGKQSAIERLEDLGE